MEMVIGFTCVGSEWPDKHCLAQRRRNRAISFNRFRVIQKSVSDAVNVRRCSPGMNTFCAADLMRGRAVAAVCADEDRPAYFPPKIFQKHRKQKTPPGAEGRKSPQNQARSGP